MLVASKGTVSGHSRVYPFTLKPQLHENIINKFDSMTHSEKAEYSRAAVKLTILHPILFDQFLLNKKNQTVKPRKTEKHSRRGRPECPPRVVVSLTAHLEYHKDVIGKLEPQKNRTEYIINSILFAMTYPDLLLDTLSSKFVTFKQLSMNLNIQKTQAL